MKLYESSLALLNRKIGRRQLLCLRELWAQIKTMMMQLSLKSNSLLNYASICPYEYHVYIQSQLKKTR